MEEEVLNLTEELPDRLLAFDGRQTTRNGDCVYVRVWMHPFTVELSDMPFPQDAKPPLPLPYGAEAHVIQKYDTSPAFPGYVIGTYQRLDGPRGYVLQHERDRIVHVYPEQAVAEGLNEI